jgi:hypothetical protein
MFDSIFSDESLQDYVQQNTHDPWIGTPFEGYVHMSPNNKVVRVKIMMIIFVLMLFLC